MCSKRGPVLHEIKIEVTHKCPLRCLHCSSVAGIESAPVMTGEDCQRIIEEAARMGVKELAISGGEPLLWPHLASTVEVAKRRGLQVKLYTCGNAPNSEAVIKDLCTNGLDAVAFSLYAGSSLIHEHITDVPRSYAGTLAGIRTAISSGLRTEVHFVAMVTNYHELPSVAKLARNLGCERVSILRFVPQGRGSSAEQILMPRQNAQLKHIIETLRSDGHSLRTGSPLNFLLVNEHPECPAGISCLTIGPDFRVFPCDAFKHVTPTQVGVDGPHPTLLDTPLEICWQTAPYLEAVRALIANPSGEECRNCPHTAQCGGGCLAQKLHAGFLSAAPDPACLRHAGHPPAALCAN